jgi:hypothetical protein
LRAALESSRACPREQALAYAYAIEGASACGIAFEHAEHAVLLEHAEHAAKAS